MILNDMSPEDRLVFYICKGDNEEAQKILQDINPTDLVYDLGNGLLHFAAEHGNSIMTKCLIDLGCDVDAKNEHGNTPLILASRKSHADVIRILIEANASVLFTNNQGESAAGIFFRSAEMKLHGVYLKLDLFLLKLKKECSDDSLKTAQTLFQLGCTLPRAVKLKDIAITKYMLEKGCGINDADDDYLENTPLHEAVRCDDLEHVKLLIDHGADVNSKDGGGRQPLFFARGKQITKTLLDHGAKPTVNGTLVNGRLFQDGDEEMIEFLLQCDLNFSARDRFQITIFYYLLQNKNFDTTEIIKQNIDDSSYDINKKNGRGNTLLADAVGACNFEVVEFLLRKGAIVNILDVDGGSPLAYTLASPKSEAVQKVRTKILMLLLEYGANVQLINSSQFSMLHYALVFKSFDVANFIVAHIALIEERGIVIKDVIRNEIDFNETFKNHYDFCKTKIESMKHDVVCEQVTLFKLLTAKGDEIADLASNNQLVQKLQSILDQMRNPKLYYYKVLQKNIMKIVTLAADTQLLEISIK